MDVLAKESELKFDRVKLDGQARRIYDDLIRKQQQADSVDSLQLCKNIFDPLQSEAFKSNDLKANTLH